MKALVLEAYGLLKYMDVPEPVLRAADEVLVRVRAAAICGSDVHGMDGSTGRRKPPIIMGHEAAGEIALVGAAVHGFSVGDRVTFDSTVYCGKCWHCLRGEVNLCDDRRVLGVSCAEYRRDGAFAQFVVVPERILYRLPEGLDFVSAALAEPVGVAAHAASLAPRGKDDSTAVVGAGLIGLLLIQILGARRAADRSSGKIVALDIDAARRETALRLGADAAVDPMAPGAIDEVRRLCSGRGADRAYEAVGATVPIRTAIDCLRKGGSLTLIGNARANVEIPLQAIVTRQLSIYGSCAIAGEYPEVLRSMADGSIEPRKLLSAVAPLSEGASWFQRLYAKEKGLLKVVLEP